MLDCLLSQYELRSHKKKTQGFKSGKKANARVPSAPNDISAPSGWQRAPTAKRHTRHPPLVLRELLHDQRVAQVQLRRPPRALEPRLVWPPRVAMPRTGAPSRAMQCVPVCADTGRGRRDERSLLHWRWEARHADRGAVARRGAQAGDGASRTANAIGPLARHRHGVPAALSIRAVRRRLLLLCFCPM